MSKIKILGVIPSIMPSTILSILKPLMKLQNCGLIKLQLGFSFFYNKFKLKRTNILVLCRNCEVNDYKLLCKAIEYQKKIIFDIDDNFYDIDVKTDLGKYHRNPVRLFLLDSIIQNSDYIRVYSEPLMKRISEQNSRISLKKAYFDLSLINNLQKEVSDKIRITYATSRGEQDDLYKLFEPAIEKILIEYPTKVEFYIWGFRPDKLAKYKNCISLPLVKNYDEFIKTFYRKNFDIGLAPLKDDIFHNSKTNNKYREYGGMNVAGVYSDSELYRSCIKNYFNGILVPNNHYEWYMSIKELIENKDLLKDIKANAKNDVVTNYSFESFVDEWKKDINLVYENNYLTKKTNNILELNILLLYRKTSITLERRDTALFLMRSLGINYYAETLENFIMNRNSKKFDYDVVMIFNDILESVDDIIDIIGKQHQIIIDSEVTIPITKNNNVKYIFSHNHDKVDNEKIFYIPTIQIDREKYRNIYINEFNSVKKNYDDSMRNTYIRQYERDEELFEEIFFSRLSPAYLYANVLSGLDCDIKFKKENIIFNLLNHIIEKSTLVRNVVICLKKIILKLKNWHHRIRIGFYYLKTLVYVNVFKIYK